MVTKKQDKEQETWIRKPKKSCTDKKCPFHGTLKVHGRVFVGTILNNLFHKTVTIEFARRFYLPKYERYEKRRTKLRVHVPPCIEVAKGMTLRVAETRPISKMKNFVAVGVVEK